jgi:hypothetical protein
MVPKGQKSVLTGRRKVRRRKYGFESRSLHLRNREEEFVDNLMTQTTPGSYSANLGHEMEHEMMTS